jgi:transcriptional regulator with XRE-family HTH domain
MSPILHIRKDVLKMTQAEMAVLTGARQATVSRWELGQLEPSREQMQAIRSEALRRGIEWSDEWFFGPPRRPTEAA